MTSIHLKEIEKLVDNKQKNFVKLADKIWELAETRFEEFESAKLLTNVLEEAGFVVEKGVGGIETAFIATFDQGGPVVGILGEYDALSGLSQERNVAEAKPIVPNGNGHGCGHNMLGVAGISAAVALKDFLEANPQIKGTVKYFGCPGEEGGSGKTFMVREGVFEGIDAALTWHPESYSGVFHQSSLANYQVYFSFKGIASHAANSPHLGRSALDAVELMNVGVNYLREHVIPEARIHYAVTNTGGISPNVVQADAEVLYLIRAPKISQVIDIYNRVINIAKGAALMTETEVEVRFDKACSNYIPNAVLGEVMGEYLEEVGFPQYTEEELSFACNVKATITPGDVENKINDIKNITGYSVKKIESFLKDSPFIEKVIPFHKTNGIMFGSTDVGDVSWNIPTAQFWGRTFVFGTPLHTWQVVSQGGSTIGTKGMIQAAKVLAGTTLHLFEHPELIDKAKEELAREKEGNEYIPPIPNDVKPSALK
ncbi:amidohydrolase [Heyndrickxia sporothermodurans]|uniref:M20 family metallopeptidase n=1 Tax=Heyndrickxia sporothermodurans TaxID=46224 RepID=UPI000D38AAD7|nr:M20 family metallopeptidase [Heyndrickxia sporothermodurans]PTY76191.1 amidohydrolase [Heyndrickxia sporothermodurans]